MEPPRFAFGAEVRVIRTLRNDGTFPGLAIGAVLVRRGSTGVVRDIGTFLQDQIIYTVHFTQADRMVGCRDRELIAIDAAWIPSRFETGDAVRTTIGLGVSGELVADTGAIGEILKVERDAPGGVAYHVRFPGRTFLVPETALGPADGR